VRGWVWPGSQRLANQRQGAWAGAVNQEILPNEREVRPLRGLSPTDVITSPSLIAFKRRLKTLLYSRSFDL